MTSLLLAPVLGSLKALGLKPPTPSDARARPGSRRRRSPESGRRREQRMT